MARAEKISSYLDAIERIANETGDLEAIKREVRLARQVASPRPVPMSKRAG